MTRHSGEEHQYTESFVVFAFQGLSERREEI